MRSILIFCFVFIAIHLHAQPRPEPDFYDAGFVKKHKLRSVKIYAGSELQEAYDFNLSGKVIKEFPAPEKTGEHEENNGDSIAYVRDASGKRIMRQLYFKYNKLSYADSFVYDAHGNLARVFRVSPDGEAAVRSATTYDERNNPIEDISYGQEYGVNRWVRRYDAAGRQLVLRQYQWFTQSYHMDSSIYDPQGRIVEHYSYSFDDEQPVLEERYGWTYDGAGNMVSMIKARGDAQVWEHANYVYDRNRQLKEFTSFNHFEKVNPFRYTTYRYDKHGMIAERKVYYSDKDIQPKALPKPNTMKWVYTYYK